MVSRIRHRVKCKYCSKIMRENNLGRHIRRINETAAVDSGEKHGIREVLTSQPRVEIAGLEESMQMDACVYRDRVELGKHVAGIIDRGGVPEESLTVERKEALDLYRKQCPRMDLKDVQLRPWQRELLNKMIASERDVIWVSGARGNEGKSWFQGYIETLYGYSRAVRLDICNKTSNILHALSRRPLQTTDTFLFNDVRSQMGVNYAVLESIKDGCATSSKYGSRVLNFRTPNTVVVFSNQCPNRANLSADRWKAYYISSDGELHSEK